MNEKEITYTETDKQFAQELMHHGVKGMKWGVRKDVLRGVSDSANEASRLAGKVGTTKTIPKKTKRDTDKMSDVELRARINRQQMEQQYASLNPTAKERGAARAEKALSIIGSIAAIGASVAGIAYIVGKAKEG